MSERKEGEDRRLSERRDPSENVLLLLKNQTDYFEKLLALHKTAYDEQLKSTKIAFDSELSNAVENSRREREAESRRIDGRQAADAEMVKIANASAIKQAETLANQVMENAETLRAGMAKNAEALATQLQTMFGGFDTRLKAVETNQWTVAGTSKGKGDMWGYVFGGVMLIIAIIGFFLKF